MLCCAVLRDVLESGTSMAALYDFDITTSDVQIYLPEYSVKVSITTYENIQLWIIIKIDL